MDAVKCSPQSSSIDFIICMKHTSAELRRFLQPAEVCWSKRRQLQASSLQTWQIWLQNVCRNAARPRVWRQNATRAGRYAFTALPRWRELCGDKQSGSLRTCRHCACVDYKLYSLWAGTLYPGWSRVDQVFALFLTQFSSKLFQMGHA